MAKRIRSSTKYDGCILWAVSEKKRKKMIIISLYLYRYIDDVFMTWNKSEKN